MPGKHKGEAGLPHPFISTDSAACFQHFSTLLAATPLEKLETPNTDADIARVNIQRGYDAIEPHFADVARKLPELDLDDLRELPSIALALTFASNRIFVPASPKEIKAHQDRLRPMRALTLSYLEIAAALGLVPADLIKAIRANNGSLDEAHDGVAIVAVFHDFASALKGKHPFTEEQLHQLSEDANWLIQQLTPRGAVPKKGERNPDAIVRDRIWTDVVRRHDELYTAGVVIWGRRNVEAHIPPLNSRTYTTAQPAADPAAPPAPAGTPVKIVEAGPDAALTPKLPTK